MDGWMDGLMDGWIDGANSLAVSRYVYLFISITPFKNLLQGEIGHLPSVKLFQR